MVTVTVVPSPRDRLLAGPTARPQRATVTAGGRPSHRPSVGLRELVAGALAAATTWLLVGEPGGPLAVLLVTGWALLASACRPRHGVLPAACRPPYRAVGAVALVYWAATTLEVGATVIGPAPLLLFTLAAAASSVAVDLATRRGPGAPLRVLVVGGEDDVLDVLDDLDATSARRLRGVGGCTPDEVVAALDQLTPQAVLAVPGTGLDSRLLQRLGWLLEERGIPLLVSTRIRDVAPDRAVLTRTGSLDLIEVRPPRRSGVPAAAKHAWERVAAALALLLLTPMLLGLMLWIRLDSPGPALFAQTRVGRDGRTFTLLKLRTMHGDAEVVRADLVSESDAVLFKIRRDPRITRAGRLLRKYSLDELPQLVNVMLGQMSLVGPRPALPDEVAGYDEDPRRRLVVKPGLTGLWQVSGRSDLTWSESVRLDLDYVDNWSLTRDLGIVARTFHAVLTHRGAY